MTRPFAFEDFPVSAIGRFVYRGTSPMPFCIANTVEIATEIALRMNRDDTAFPSAHIEQLVTNDLPETAGRTHTGSLAAAVSVTKHRPDPELDHTLSVVSDALNATGEAE